eukprot:Skav213217  [mRNA]  locus=scaffold2826:651240:653206:- [translate_table: standard]
MDPAALLRDVYKYTLKDFKAVWASVGDFIIMEAMDNNHQPQGLSVLAIQQVYQAEEEGAFAIARYVASNDDYYRYWAQNEMDPDTYHHFCRGPSVRSCISKLGKDLVIHVRRWAPLTLKEAESVLRAWGMSPTLAKKALVRAPDSVKERSEANSSGTPRSKTAPPLPPAGVQSLGPDLAGEVPGEHERRPARRRRRDDSRDSKDERHNPGGAASGSRDLRARVVRKTARRQGNPQAAALDEMLEAEGEDPKADEVYQAAKSRLATLKESLNAKKAVKGGGEPGVILATRAAAVADKLKKKKKKDKTAEHLAAALKGVMGKKVVKDEVDYDEEEGGAASEESEEEDDSDEDSGGVLSGGLGSGKSSVNQQRKLRLLSEKQPGKLLSQGFATMHDQIGTHFGHEEKKGGKLSPVAVRYLLSFAMPQFTGGVSHHKYRELRTLATALDQLVMGRTGQCGDLILLMPPSGEKKPNAKEGEERQPKPKEKRREGSQGGLRRRERSGLGSRDPSFRCELSADEGDDAKKRRREPIQVEEPSELGHDECPAEEGLIPMVPSGGESPGAPLGQCTLVSDEDNSAAERARAPQ